MKKHFLMLLLLIAGFTAPAFSMASLPFYEDFSGGTPSFGTGDDQFNYVNYDDKPTSWTWSAYNGYLRTRGANNTCDRVLLLPRMPFEVGKVYYFEFEIPQVGMDDINIEIHTHTGPSYGDGLKLIKTINIPTRQTGKHGVYIAATEGMQRISLEFIKSSGYVSSYVGVDNLVVKEVEPNSPGDVTDLTVSEKAPGVKVANVSFTSPTKSLLGADLTAPVTEIFIDVNGNLVKTVENPAAGQQLNLEVPVSTAGDLKFSITAANSFGKGSTVNTYANIGGAMQDPDTDHSYNPEVPTHQKAYALYTSQGAKITWLPNANAASYYIVKMPQNERIAEGLTFDADATECSYLDEFTYPEDPTFVWYQVVWVNDANSPTNLGRTNVLSVNNTVPYNFAIQTGPQASQVTQYHPMREGYSCQHSSWYGNMDFGLNTAACNSYAMLPGVKLEAGKHYRFDVYSMVNYSPCNMEFLIGKENTLTDLQTIIQEVTVKNTYNEFPEGVRYIGYFTPEESCNYFPTVHAYSTNSTGTTIYFPSIKITEVGDDLPGAIEEVTVKFDPTNANKATIFFKAPTVNLNGGTLASIDKIYVKKDRELFKTLTDVQPGQDMSFDVTVSAEEQFEYTIWAENSSGEGVMTTVPVFIVNAPYNNEFTDNKTLNGWTIINDDPMSSWTWHIQSNAARAYPDWSQGRNLDDWLITPPVHLEAGKYYKTNFITYGNSLYDTNRISLWLGNEPTAEAMTTNVIPEYTPCQSKSRNDGALLWEYFTVEETGEYYLGFHAYAEANGDELYVDNFNIFTPVEGTVPGPAGLEVLPNKSGALDGILRITVPEKQINGQSLKDNNKSLWWIFIYQDGELVGKIDADPATNKKLTWGDTFDFPVTVANEGVHLYDVIVCNSNENGKEKQAVGFFGINRPYVPINMHVKETNENGVVRFDWEPNPYDYDGFPINPAHMTYDLFIVDYDNQQEVPIATGLTALTHTARVKNATDKQDFIRFGIRAWTKSPYQEKALGSPGCLFEYVCVGEPAKTPWHESFSNRTPDMCFVSQSTGEGPSRWAFDYYLDVTDPIDPQDGDRGLAIMEVLNLDAGSRLFSGKIDLKGLQHPGLTMWVYNNGADPKLALNTVSIDVRRVKDGNEAPWTSLRSNTISEYSANMPGWMKLKVDLTPVKDEVIYLGLNATCHRQTFTIVDNLTIDEYPEHDLLMLNVEAPEYAAPGRPFAVTANAFNLSDEEVDDYEVELYRDGKLVSTKACGALTQNGKARVRFTDTLTSHEAGTHTYTAKAVYALEQNPADNEASVDFCLNESALPGVENLVAVQSAPAEVTVTWEAPVLKKEATVVEEDFESYAAWTNKDDQMGQWKNFDMDKGEIYGIGDGNGGNLLPGKVDQNQQAWFVLDYNNASFIDREPFLPHSGGQCLLSMVTKSYAGSDYIIYGKANDWLVSPVLSGKEQTISFWVKNFSVANDEGEVVASYPLVFSVYTNTDMENTQPSDFVLLETKSIQPNEWTKVEYTLPEGTQHFAIVHETGYDGYMMFLDDITFTAGGDERLQPTGFHVYKNGERIVTNGRMPSFVDTDVEDGMHEYHVSVGYNLGESELKKASILSSEVGALSAAQKVSGGKGFITLTGVNRSDIYAPNGMHLYTVEGSTTVPVAPGVYVVKADGKVYKVTVK